MLYEGEPLPHFNEVDECAGLDGLMTYRVHKAMGQPVENTLHDLRWGDVGPQRHGRRIRVGLPDLRLRLRRRTSSAAGPAPAASASRAMYFRLGGGTLKGISKPGEIVWCRIYVDDGELSMDLGRAGVVELPDGRNPAPLGSHDAAVADHARRDLRRHRATR